MWTLLLLISNAFLIQVASCDPNITATISMDTSHLVHTTHERFLSTAMTPHLVRKHFAAFNFSSPLVLTLARGLAPALMRFGDTDADRMVYVGRHGNADPVIPFPVGGFNITATDWDKINQFAGNVGWRMVYGLNAQIRINNGTNSTAWYPANARQILNYSVQRGYSKNMDFELGNEPNIYSLARTFQHVTPEQLASDFCNLRRFLANFTDTPFTESLVIGPDVTAHGFGFLKRFLDKSVGCVDATSWHQYYGLGTSLNHPDNYTDPDILDRYLIQVKLFNSVIKSSKQPNVKVWQGETASTVTPPPGSNIDESFVATFMLLDKLGVSALHGIDVVIKQAFFGFWFSLIDNNFQPTPNYWIALLFKRLVGEEVLSTKVTLHPTVNNSRHLRTYAHCTSRRSGYAKGSVVIYIMNIFKTSVELRFDTNITSQIDQFMFSPPKHNLTSIDIKLNGKLLQMVNDETLPAMMPEIYEPQSTVHLPPKSLAFYVLPHLKLKICL